jgi:aryl-alcohol dehydrogenase-like predicted oxidoreductase
MSGDMTYRHLGRSGRRDDIVLAIKVYQPMGSGPNDRRLSAYRLFTDECGVMGRVHRR